MVTFIFVHLVSGILLGRFFRIGIMLPAVLVIVAESVVMADRYAIAPWYVLAIVGVAATQAGYALAARFRPARRSEHPSERVPPTAASPPANRTG